MDNKGIFKKVTKKQEHLTASLAGSTKQASALVLLSGIVQCFPNIKAKNLKLPWENPLFSRQEYWSGLPFPSPIIKAVTTK